VGIIDGVKNVGKGVAGGIGKILTPPKSTKIVEQNPYHTRESVEDYANRITKRRVRRY
jgi:hypothetical protein